MEPTIVVPSNLAGLYVILSNPLIVSVALSTWLEHAPVIQDKTVANWKKVLLVIAVALVWAFGVALFSPTGIVLTPAGLYGIVVSGLGLAFGMNVTNMVLSGMPLLKQFILTLFGRGGNAPTPVGGGSPLLPSADPTQFLTSLLGGGVNPLAGMLGTDPASTALREGFLNSLANGSSGGSANLPDALG